MIAILLTLV